MTYASVYIQVFLEDEHIQTTYHWELRYRYFTYLCKEENDQLKKKMKNLEMHSHQIPYLVCGCLCLILYWINMCWKYTMPFVQTTLGTTLTAVRKAVKIHFFTDLNGYCQMSTWRAILDIVLGIWVSVLLFVIFTTYWNVQSTEVTKLWERVKKLDREQEEKLRMKLGLHSTGK